MQNTIWPIINGLFPTVKVLAFGRINGLFPTVDGLFPTVKVLAFGRGLGGLAVFEDSILPKKSSHLAIFKIAN